jgi:hypothetical protein
MAALVAGCGSGGDVGAPSHSRTQTPAAASSSGATPQLRVVADNVSMASVQQRIARLYRDHPAVSRYSAQDVTYTSRSRARVLRACSDQGASATQQGETARVLACAPLVFFYYQYGRVSGINEATNVADSIYSYASTQIHGPSNAQGLLDRVLRGWGLPVSAAITKPPSSTSPAATALIASMRHAIGVRRSVRVMITGYRGGAQPRERIAIDVGRTASAETLHAGSAFAEIRTVHHAAFISGNTAGLRRLIGLPQTVASRTRGRWLRAPSGSAASRNLSAENSLAAVSSSILPQVGDSVRISSGHTGATTTKVLS